MVIQCVCGCFFLILHLISLLDFIQHDFVLLFCILNTLAPG